MHKWHRGTEASASEIGKSSLARIPERLCFAGRHSTPTLAAPEVSMLPAGIVSLRWQSWSNLSRPRHRLQKPKAKQRQRLSPGWP